jgi:hypothetical protein
MSSFALLLQRIEGFIKRFYMNRLLRGGLIFVAVTVAVFLVFVNIEYFALLGSKMRAALFFSFLFLFFGLLWYFIIDPLLKLYKVGKRLSYNEAGKMIGKLIPGIEDKITNTLQLSTHQDNALAIAAIEQKSLHLGQYPFSSVINLKENKRFLWYVLPVLASLVFTHLWNPDIITSGSERIVNYNQVYERSAPFDFVLASDIFPIEEGTDAEVRVKLKGDDIPSKVFVQSNYGRFMMKEVGKNEFAYVLPKVRKDVKFHFAAADFKSGTFEIPVFGSSSMAGLSVDLIYPSYTGKDNETIDNPVMLSVPIGTKARFKGVLKNADSAKVSYIDTAFSVGSSLSHDYRFMRSQDIKFEWRNKYNEQQSVIEKRVEVVPDLHPSIDVKRNSDTTNARLFFFNGEVRDDYGVSALNFVTEVKDVNGKLTIKRTTINAALRSGGGFYHMFDINGMNLSAGEIVYYYFEVYDNDAVNGAKRSTSARYEFKVPTADELKDKRQDALSNAQSGMNTAQKEMERFQRSLEELRKANLNKNTQGWKKQEMLDRLKLQQQNLQDLLKQEQQQLDNAIKDQERFDQVDEELFQKQQELNDLFEQLMDSELKDLLDKLQELMDQNKQVQFEDLMKDFEMSNEEMKNQLDRSMEMLKRMEVEERMERVIDDLKSLQEQQEQLSNETSEKEAELQKELKEEFDKLMEELEKILEKNEELKNPMDLDDMKDLQKDIQDKMDNAQDKLDKKQDSKANQPQKDAAKQMKKMQESLSQQMEEQKKKEQGENIDTLRSILFNLMRLSFDQEHVMLSMQQSEANSPTFTKLTREQRKVMDDHQVVKDSLLALAERVPKIGSLIDQELKVIGTNFNSLTPNMHDRKLRDIAINQQFVMTSYNNLALMLNEALQNMQQDMQSEGEGSGSCDKPGGKGKKPSDGMGNMKDQLKKQLEQMQGGQKPGDKPGNQNPGGTGGPGGGMPMPIPGMSSEQVAKMAAQQAMMRKQLEEMRNELNKGKDGNGEALNPLIEELEKQEKDLVNGVDRNLIKRQQEILTRLLESEKALQERELDDKRESKTANDNHDRNLIRFDEYKKQKQREVEQLRVNTPGLSGYYRQKAVLFYNRVLSN